MSYWNQCIAARRRLSLLAVSCALFCALNFGHIVMIIEGNNKGAHFCCALFCALLYTFCALFIHFLCNLCSLYCVCFVHFIVHELHIFRKVADKPDVFLASKLKFSQASDFATLNFSTNDSQTNAIIYFSFFKPYTNESKVLQHLHKDLLWIVLISRMKSSTIDGKTKEF